MLLSRHGAREMLIITLACAALGGGAAVLHPLAAIPFVMVWAAGLAFFRDPHRRVPKDADVLVAPADGVVTEITELADDPLTGGAATRIGIFLSVLDVHVNRSPCAGRIARVDYKPGEFLDARHPECGQRNESNTLLIEPDGRAGLIAVRQVAGLIARRIICAAAAGERLERGQRFGLIKFGSRTELHVPQAWVASLRVRIGDRVRGGADVLVQLSPVTRADEETGEAAAERIRPAPVAP